MGNEGGGFAASIYGAMPCAGISVTSHSRFLIPSYSSLIPAFKLQVDEFRFVVRRTNQKRRKFESRDKWLGIRDWGLAVTGDWDSPASSSRAQPRDLYCAAGISVYVPRKNDVLVQSHIRQ